jgi:hypothetical protein
MKLAVVGLFKTKPKSSTIYLPVIFLIPYDF